MHATCTTLAQTVTFFQSCMLYCIFFSNLIFPNLKNYHAIPYYSMYFKIRFQVLPHELKIRRLEVSVCHDGGRLGKNEVLSRFIVSLDQVQVHVLKGDPHPTITDWYTLPPDVNRSMTLLTSQQIFDFFIKIDKINVPILYT